MEYVQMTLDDWVQMKQKLKQELLGVKQSFVRIGYALRQIDDQKLYEQDGYKSIAEFAQAEYGLGPSITSRFMSINREYSIDGYSEQLRPEYAELGRSQLEEMLKLPDADRQMIQPETSREDIRELKRFNKTEPAAGVADDISQLVEKFYQDNELILNAVYGEEFDEQTINRFIEIVNPAGNRSYKKGLYFMMMYENRVTFKKFGDTPKDMTWWEFYQLTREIFDDTAAGTKTWQNHFGGADDEESTTRVQYGPYLMNPYLALLRVEFTVPRTVTSRAVRSYRTLSPLPDPACAGHRRFALCCTGRGFPPQALPGTLPYGARTFLPSARLPRRGRRRSGDCLVSFGAQYRGFARPCHPALRIPIASVAAILREAR